MTKLVKNSKKKNKASNKRSDSVGITLRDHMATEAMRALLAAAPGMDPALIACDAYAFADSMLAVRERAPVSTTEG